MTENPKTNPTSNDRFSFLSMWLIFFGLAFTVALISTAIIHNHGKEMEQHTLDNLMAIAELKASQTEQWLEQQKTFIQISNQNSALKNHVQQFLKGNQVQANKTAISELLSNSKQLGNYKSITLITPEYKTIVHIGENWQPPKHAIEPIIERAKSSQTIQRTGFLNETDASPHLKYIAPILNNNAKTPSTIAFLVFHIDPKRFIFPFLQHWPTKSETGETLLVRQQGDNVLFLTPLRHLSSEEVITRPLSQISLPASVALKNKKPGFISGLDYRQHAVMAAYRPVKNTDWMIISKIDKSEAKQSISSLTNSILVVSSFSILAIGALFIKLLKKERRSQKLMLRNQKLHSEQVLKHFYNLPFIGMAILEPEHYEWLRFNPRLTEILGYSPHQLEKKQFSTLLDPSDADTILKKMKDIKQNKIDGFTEQVRLRCAQNQTVFCILNIKCIRDDNNQVLFYLVTLQDTTEFKQLFEENLTHIHQLKTLFNSIPDLIWLKDVNGNYLSCNHQFEQFFGAPEHKIVGKTDYDFVDRKLADFFRKHDLNAMQRNQPTENEECLTFAQNGYKGLFSTVKAPVRDEEGKVIGVLGVARDISNRKQAEEKLQRLNRLYSAMSQTNEAIVHAQDEASLLSKVCRIAVEEGGMSLAWIGQLNPKTQTITPNAWFGKNVHYLDGLEISTDPDQPSGQGPTAIALRTQQPYWCQDFELDPHTANWHQRGAVAGWKASAALPLTRNGEIFGAFNLYSTTSHAFDPDIQNLLKEMACDISFALSEFVHREARQRAEQDRQEIFDRLTKLSKRLPGMIFQARMTPDGNIRLPFSSGTILDIYGVNPEEVKVDAGSVFETIHPEDLPEFQSAVEESAHNLTPWKQEYRARSKDGSYHWLYGNAMPEREADGSTLWHGFISDITERKKAESQIELASKVFEQSREGIMITDSNHNILMVNKAFTRITGYEPKEVLGKSPKLLSSGRHGIDFYEEIWNSLSETGHWEGEIWNKRKNGELYPEWLSIRESRNARNEVSEYIGVFSDISKAKDSEQKIQYLAHYDSLTGLANRQLLIDRVQQMIRSAQRHHHTFAVLFFDLDHFKHINDSLGHHVGDQLLIAVSERISSLLRDEDTLARQGGDEFITLLPDAGENGATRVSDKIINALSAPYQLNKHKVFITTSIGIALYPNDGSSAYTLLKKADTAMYQAKQEGRNTYRFFTEKMQLHSLRTMQIENALRSAIVNNELFLHYQPQIDAKSLQVVGLEALIRWEHEQLGNVPPLEFICIAEQSGQILEIGEWVIKTAVKQFKKWQHSFPSLETLAVNISAVQLKQADLPSKIINLLDQEGLSTSCLELELTESVAMHSPESAIKMMKEFRKHDIKIAIDDFGTGYSSLNYLKRFNATKLKIDQSFVRDIHIDPNDRAIVQATISLAKSLGMQTIAEGVETAEQLAFLQEHDCDEIQGYLFSCPLADTELERFIREYRPINKT